MFVHWSETGSTYRDMEKADLECSRCNAITLHTMRLYETKTKHYSVLSFGANYRVTAICHQCLLESEFDKNTEHMLINKYKLTIELRKAFKLLENEDNVKDAIKKFEKVLKEDPKNAHAMFGMAKGLIALKRYYEAEYFVSELTKLYPHDEDVAEMRTILETNLTG